MTNDSPMMPGMARGARMRAYLVGVVITLGLFGVVIRAWALQISDGPRYRTLAARQHGARIDIPPPRGDVIDRKGRPLAVSADTDSIWANPRDVRDVATTSDTLAGILRSEPSKIEKKLAGGSRFVWIDRHVNPDVARQVQRANLPGIETAKEPRRWYPGRDVGGAVVGRVDIDGKGLDGVELAMDHLLSGKRAAVAALRDAHGHMTLPDGVAAIEPGATVRLTLDRSLQAIAESALQDGMAKHKAKAAVAVVLDVASSRVLAMASAPGYDPNTGDAHGARNLAVTDAFEAGSVLKVFSVATALDAGVVSPTTGFSLGNSFSVGNRPIRDVHPDPYLTVSGIIKRSSNIGAAKIALRLGSDKLYAGLRRFGFGDKTGIELPGERTGSLRAAEKWREIDLAHIAFGYGLTVTPLQLAAALASIGNRGQYREPRIIDEVIDHNGAVAYRGDGAGRQVVSPKTADAMMAMLISVFDKDQPKATGDNGGTAKDIDVVGFRCAGKTGTAHKYDPETKQYSNRYLSSFAGLAPADHPQLAIVVMVDDPRGGDYYGSKVAGPIFATIASESLRYLGVPGAPAPMQTPAELPKASAPKSPPQEAVPEQSAVAIPDFTAMGMQRALDVAATLHLPVNVIGSGRVTTQKPLPGPRDGATELTLWFSDDGGKSLTMGQSETARVGAPDDTRLPAARAARGAKRDGSTSAATLPR